MAKAVLEISDSSSAFQIIGNRSVTPAALNSCNGSKFLAKINSPINPSQIVEKKMNFSFFTCFSLLKH
jgi:hypothetical protein